jgi:hypothetical protein
MPTPVVNLDIDLGTPAGEIKPLHGVNLGPLHANGWLDTSATYRRLSFPYTRLHDCPYAVPETVDVHSIFPIFDADPQVIPEESVKVRELLAGHGFERTESHLNEWNYLPAEGWLFNSPEKDPACIRRAVEEISGVPGAGVLPAHARARERLKYPRRASRRASPGAQATRVA